MSKALKSCPKSNWSPNLATLVVYEGKVAQNWTSFIFKWSVLILGRSSITKKQNYFFFGAAMCKSQNRCGKRSTHDDVLDQFVTLTFWVRVLSKSWPLRNFWPSNQRQRELFECCQNAKSSVIFMQTASTLLSFQKR